MSGEWSIRLGGASGLVISKSTIYGRDLAFLPQIRRRRNAKGETEGWDYTLQVEANIVTTTPALVASGLTTLFQQITTFGARQFEALLDGSTWLSITPAQCFQGPFVSEVEPIDDEGNGNGHWRYRFIVDAFVKNGVGFELYTAIREKRNPGNMLVAKTWIARATAKTAASALAKCLQFKPGGSDIYFETFREFQDGRAEATWTWTAVKAKTNNSWTCKVMIRPGGPDYESDPQVGSGASPVLHELENDAWEIEVEGTIVGTDPTKLVPPAPHFTSSEKIKRVPRRERRQQGQEILSADEGTYVLRYHEFYLSDGEPPQAKHEGGHNLIPAGSAPGDGGMG